MCLPLFLTPSKKLRTQRMRGFTLIELLVTLAVSAILIGVGVPAFDSVSLTSHLRSYANTVAASAQTARSEATKRKAVVSMCVSIDGIQCTAGSWEQGWILLSGGNVIKERERNNFPIWLFIELWLKDVVPFWQ